MPHLSHTSSEKARNKNNSPGSAQKDQSLKKHLFSLLNRSYLFNRDGACCRGPARGGSVHASHADGAGSCTEPPVCCLTQPGWFFPRVSPPTLLVAWPGSGGPSLLLNKKRKGSGKIYWELKRKLPREIQGKRIKNSKLERQRSLACTSRTSQSCMTQRNATQKTQE